MAIILKQESFGGSLNGPTEKEPRQNRNRTENESENVLVNRNINIFKMYYVKFSINELM